MLEKLNRGGTAKEDKEKVLELQKTLAEVNEKAVRQQSEHREVTRQLEDKIRLVLEENERLLSECSRQVCVLVWRMS